jgi:arylsulfatase
MRMVLVLTAGLLLVACQPPPLPDPQSNVLIISVDTLRADAVGPDRAGSAVTPVLDRLYASGTSFSRTFSPMPRTTPALASLLTGWWTWRHGSREVAEPMDHGTTLAEVLGELGWQTGAVSANLSASARENLDRGFDRFIGYSELEDLYGERLLKDLDDTGHPDAVGWATATTDQALAMAEQLRPDRPFLLWLFYFDPHFIYLPPARFRHEQGECWQLYQYFDRHRELGGQLYTDVGGRTSAALADCRRLYEAEIEYLDSELGRLLDGLAERDLLRNTVIVFTADHGENIGEGGVYFEHGSNVYDSALRVPLVFVGPGIAAARADTSITSLTDVTPTLLSLLGVPQELRPRSDGIDLSPRLLAEAPPAPDSERIVFAESAAAVWHEQVQVLITGRDGHRVCLHDQRYTLCRPGVPGPAELFDHIDDPQLSIDIAAEHPAQVQRLEEDMKRWTVATARERAARSSRFKLVLRPEISGGFKSALFDLEADPLELNDVQHLYPEEVRRLRAALEGWLALQPVPGPSGDPDPETEQRLRALGYAGE